MGEYFWPKKATYTDTVTNKTSNYTITDLDKLILVDASGGDITITLPVLTQNAHVKISRIDNTVGNFVYIAPDTGVTIFNTSAPLVLTAANTSYEIATEATDFTTYYII